VEEPSGLGPETWEEYEANGYLLAAAPRMLEALKAVQSCPMAAPWLARLPIGDSTAWELVCLAAEDAEHGPRKGGK
jgi:hypothetical protein